MVRMNPTSLRLLHALTERRALAVRALRRRPPYDDIGGPSRHEVLVLAVSRGVESILSEGAPTAPVAVPTAPTGPLVLMTRPRGVV